MAIDRCNPPYKEYDDIASARADHQSEWLSACAEFASWLGVQGESTFPDAPTPILPTTLNVVVSLANEGNIKSTEATPIKSKGVFLSDGFRRATVSVAVGNYLTSLVNAVNTDSTYNLYEPNPLDAILQLLSPDAKPLTFTYSAFWQGGCNFIDKPAPWMHPYSPKGIRNVGFFTGAFARATCTFLPLNGEFLVERFIRAPWKRRKRIFGRSDRPAWRSIHEAARLGKKFKKHRDELVAGNNSNGYGNAATSDWKDKAWNKAKSIAIDAAKGAVKDGAKHILKKASERAKLKKTVSNRLKELIRPR